jgi:predicted DNA binding CopG/RHH family protein
MVNKVVLDDFENDIESNLEKLERIGNLKEEIAFLTQTAKNQKKSKKSITIRINEVDLEIMQIKASKLGIPYQTYINMLIHKNAMSGI